MKRKIIEKKRPINNSGQKTQPEPQDAPSATIDQTNPSQKDKQKFKQKLHDHLKEPTGLFEAAGLIVLVIGVVVNGALWLAQIHANGINQATFVSSQRPYISFKIGNPVPPGIAVSFGEGAGDLVIPVEVVNSGSTWPTRLHVRVWCGINGALPVHNYTGVKPMTGDMFVAPKDTSNFGSCGTPQQSVQADSVSYIGAEAIYTDSFSKEDTFVTEYCVTINGLSETPGKTDPGFQYYIQLCPTHNCADAGCKPEDIPHS